MSTGRDWLAVHYHSHFRLNASGRTERENDPDGSPGPRFWLGGCADGNVFGIGADIPEDAAIELEAFAADEPPFVHPATPRHLDRYLSILDAHAPAAAPDFGLIYALPRARPAWT